MEYSAYIKNNYLQIKERAAEACNKAGRMIEDVLILPVSKTHPIDAIISGIQSGLSCFGENYAQELRDKHQLLENLKIEQPKWHFIGHLQTNKVKYIAPFVEMIHSVDSLSLAKEISKQAEKNEREIDILFQVNTSGEFSKSGAAPEETIEIIHQISEIPNIKLCGLMTIGSFSDDERVYRSEFQTLRGINDEIKSRIPQLGMKHLSMGMTGDFETAIEEGATIIRIGTAIFGNRDYSNSK